MKSVTIDKHTTGHWPIEMLIKMVQENHLMMCKIKERGDNPPNLKNLQQELIQLRMVTQDRLRELNRYDPSFFPIGSFVKYRDGNNDFESTIKKDGKVVGVAGGDVQVLFFGDEYQTRVQPKNLTLSFIQQEY